MEAITQEEKRDLETTPLQQVDAGPIQDLEIGMEEKMKQIQEQHQKDMEAMDEQIQKMKKDVEAKDERIQQLERELEKRKRRSSSCNEVCNIKWSDIETVLYGGHD